MQQTTQALSVGDMAQKLYLKSKELYQAGNLDAAANISAEINKTPYANFSTYMMETRCLYEMHRFSEVITPLEKAIELDPENVSLLENIIQIFNKIGNIEASYPYYDRIMRLQPDGYDQMFNEHYDYALKKSGSCPTPITRRTRFFQLAEIFKDTIQSVQDGDVVECGCYRGLSSLMMARYWSSIDPHFTGQGFHIMDSFEGLSDIKAEDQVPDNHPNAASIRAMTRKGCFSASYDHVKNTLSDYPDITFYKGWLPGTLADLPADGRYRFVNIDVDIYEPTLGCFEYFWPRLVKGGVIISDDYNWPGAFKAINQVKDSLEEGTYQFTTTEFGQAILRKMV